MIIARRRSLSFLALSAAISVFSAPALAQDAEGGEIIVTAQRTNPDITPPTHQITTIDREELEMARAAGIALEQITQSIHQINERNLVIASASEEQAQVSREVDRNLVNIRDLATQSAAGANQTSAATHELSRLAVDLNAMVARFVI